jgi:hypothetical protein
MRLVSIKQVNVAGDVLFWSLQCLCSEPACKNLQVLVFEYHHTT